MKLWEDPLYREDVAAVAALPLPWDKLADARIVLSGATGLLGSFLTDVLLEKNREGLDCRVLALGRSEERARARFPLAGDALRFLAHDVNEPLAPESAERVDYVLHLASNTHPVAYATDPIGTVRSNILGTDHLLLFAAERGARRCAFASSNEIYGENRGDTELFREDYCGYIDCNTLRAGYPESKRAGEALCQAYIRQKGLDVVIPRFTRSYGPTVLSTDTKAISQFIRKGTAGENIVLKSAGTQFYSYTYMADAIAGFLYVLLLGEKGRAYNIADARSDITLRELAGIVADYAGTEVVFELPDEVESAGYSRATVARLDGSLLRSLGWEARYDIRSGLYRTMDILRRTAAL